MSPEPSHRLFSHRDGNATPLLWDPNHFDRPKGRENDPISQLAASVFSPAGYRSVGRARTGVFVASGDRGHIAKPRDHLGDGGVTCGPVPQLAVVVVPPAPRSAAEQSGAGVVPTSSDASHVRKIDDPHGGKGGSGIREGAVP